MSAPDEHWVVVSHYDARDASDLVDLLDALAAVPAGAPFRVRVVVNQERDVTLRLPERHREVDVLHRPNGGYNIGAWEAGWRAGPPAAGYLFLQDECRLIRSGWLAAFVQRAAERGVGAVGERLSTSWDAPWAELERRFAGHQLPGHEVDGVPVERLACYRSFWERNGIDPGPRGDHLQTLAIYARREVLAAVGGFPVGASYGEAIAAEIGFSKRVQALGLSVREVGPHPFSCFQHPQWLNPTVRRRPLARPPSDDVVRVFVGADRTQLAGVWALEHSLRRNSSLPVEVTPMVDLAVPVPRDPQQRQRTGFSFSRFCIPKLAGYQGRAIYLDADMLVLGDVAELWRTPFDGAKVLIQRELDAGQAATDGRVGAPATRARQCAVMLLDCGRLTWEIESIVAGLDREDYTYEDLLYQLCLLDDDELGCVIPFHWNSLERLEADTRLIHYTDVHTQPWVSAKNPHDGVWLDEVRDMIRDGSLTWAALRDEIQRGHVRPSLLWDLRGGGLLPSIASPVRRRLLHAFDRRQGYRPHKALYEAKRARAKARSQ